MPRESVTTTTKKLICRRCGCADFKTKASLGRHIGHHIRRTKKMLKREQSIPERKDYDLMIDEFTESF